jgi:uncharacterized protein with PIN domain
VAAGTAAIVRAQGPGRTVSAMRDAAGGGQDGGSAAAGRVRVTVRGDLGAFLRPAARGVGAVTVSRPINGHPAAKDVIEASGVPHPEVAALLVNGRPVDLASRLSDGDEVDVLPWADAARLGLPPATPPVPDDAGAPRFVVDGHLGRLAAYLRMLGFDTWYRSDAADDELAAVAASEARIVLTRDRGLLKRSAVRRGAFVRADRPVEQLVETARRFGLLERATPFGRCIRCNGRLGEVSRAEVLDRLEPLTRRHYRDFRRCDGCGAVYWRGSHHARMSRLIERVTAEASAAAAEAGRDAEERPGAHDGASPGVSRSGAPRPRSARRSRRPPP